MLKGGKMTSIHIPILLIAVFAILLVLMIGRKRPDYTIQFFFRSGIGFVAIYFINNTLADKGIDVCVAMNAVTFLACGFLGFPGVMLLYGLVFWGYYMGM